MTQLRLSISIVHHDGREMLRDCLNSIRDTSSPENIEVIVVDNASSDGSREMLLRDFPWVKLIAEMEKNGFAHNQNIGIRASSANYILLLNDDTIVLPEALERLCSCMDANEALAVVSPKLLNADRSVQESCYRFPTPQRHVWDNFLLASAFPNSAIFGDYRKWSYDCEKEVDCVKGAALLVRRSAIETVGVLDERFFFYFEEIDWQLRMHKAGYKIMICPSAEIIHLGGRSLPKEAERLFSEFQSSSKKFVLKHYGRTGAFVQNVAIVCGAILSIVAWSAINLFARARQNQCKAQIDRSVKLLKWWSGLSRSEGVHSAKL